MKRILVGVDGSETARDALAWADNLAQRGGFEVIAARVFVPTQAEMPPGEEGDLHADQLEELRDWVGDSVSATILLDGETPDALLAAAKEHRADLLVVGGRGTGGFLHLHLGSVAHHLAHHTTLPLAIVAKTGTGAVEHVVVGADGSPGSEAAIAFTADFASSIGVDVTAVYAFEPIAEWVPETDPNSWHTRAVAETTDHTAPIAATGVGLEIDVQRELHPVAALTRALDAHPNAIAVVGTHGLGGFTGMQLGRVPLHLVHHTGAAIILVPPTA
jgi:nucleotide-binding universal stress UspA family protein